MRRDGGYLGGGKDFSGSERRPTGRGDFPVMGNARRAERVNFQNEEQGVI